jgi:membrane fusion protein (multidrug efflux system)
MFVLIAGLAAPPAGTRAADPPLGERDAAVEALKKEVAALRRRVEALERTRKPPGRERRKVVATRPQVKDVVLTQQYVGKILAHHHINVCALASGVVAEVPVKEGQAVKKGDVLFRVLPTLSQARLDAEQAEVRIAQLELDNAKKLFAQSVVSRQEVTLREAKLAKAQAKAKLAAAELNFTVVRAPFDGLIGRLKEQQGSAVKAGDALTTLSDASVVWVYYNVPEARYLEYMADRKRVKEGSPIELVLADGRKYPRTGKLGAIEAQFESGTGGIAFRADFPNPDGLLRHGQTGTVLVRRTLKGALVIPQRATFEALGRRYVWVVGEDHVAHQRPIAIRHETDDIFVIESGLSVNDAIILEGVRQVHDGDKIEYEFPKPETVVGSPKSHPGK